MWTTWKILLTFLKNIHTLSTDEKEDQVIDTVSWVITDKHGHVEENSGFNAFNGGAKLAKKR